MKTVGKPGQTNRRAVFELLAQPDTRPAFFEHVADDVIWTVMGTHPLAGTYSSKREFLGATFGRLEPLISGGVRLEVRQVHECGEVVVPELLARSSAADGRPFDNNYCLVCRFDGDQIVEVRAYLDSALVADTVARLERQAPAGG